MKAFIVPIAAMALGFTIAAAHADEVKGTIAQVDQAAGVIVLDNGDTFMIAEGADMSTLVPGTEVTVSYEQSSDGQKVAEEVVPTGQ